MVVEAGHQLTGIAGELRRRCQCPPLLIHKGSDGLGPVLVQDQVQPGPGFPHPPSRLRPRAVGKHLGHRAASLEQTTVELEGLGEPGQLALEIGPCPLNVLEPP